MSVCKFVEWQLVTHAYTLIGKA